MLHATFGGTSFLPASDSGNLMINVRTPSSSSIEYSRLKLEAAAVLARTLPETKDTNSSVTAAGGRIYVDIGKRNTRKRSAKEVAVELREKMSRLVGAEYVVQDDLSNGSQKPIQVEFTGPDSRKLMEITNAYMDKLRLVPGAVDVGLSEQDPKNELKIELNRGLANSHGHFRQRRGAVAAGGVCRRGSGRLGRSDRRDARRGRAPASRRPRGVRKYRTPADQRDGHQPDGAAGPDRQHHHGQGTVRHRT